MWCILDNAISRLYYMYTYNKNEVTKHVLRHIPNMIDYTIYNIELCMRHFSQETSAKLAFDVVSQPLACHWTFNLQLYDTKYNRKETNFQFAPQFHTINNDWSLLCGSFTAST